MLCLYCSFQILGAKIENQADLEQSCPTNFKTLNLSMQILAIIGSFDYLEKESFEKLSHYQPCSAVMLGRNIFFLQKFVFIIVKMIKKTQKTPK